MPMILPRQGIVRPPRGPLAFPGIRPGFDSSHVAAAGVQFSGVAADGGGFFNVLTGKPGTKNGTPTSVVNSVLGRTSYFSSNTDNATFSYPSTAWLSQTMAAIVVFDAATSASPRVLLSTSATAAAGMLILANATNEFAVTFGGSQTTFAAGAGVPAVTAGIPIFFAVSVQSATRYTYIVTRLDNGVSMSGGATTATALTAGDTSIYVGNRGTNSRQANGKIAAVAHSASFMSAAQLLAWANDPWSFWYPR